MSHQGVLSVGFGGGPGDYRGFGRVAVAEKKGRKLKISCLELVLKWNLSE